MLKKLFQKITQNVLQTKHNSVLYNQYVQIRKDNQKFKKLLQTLNTNQKKQLFFDISKNLKTKNEHYYDEYRMRDIIKSKLQFNENECIHFLKASIIYPSIFDVKYIENFAQKHDLSHKLQPYIKELIKKLETKKNRNISYKKISEKLQSLIGDNITFFEKDAHCPCEVYIANFIESSSKKNKESWEKLFVLCRNTQTATPTKKWETNMTQYIEIISEQTFEEKIEKFFSGVIQILQTEEMNNISQQSILTCRSLIWSIALFTNPNLNQFLIEIIKIAYKPIGNLIPRYTMLGNAAIITLGRSQSPDALNLLTIIQNKYKKPRIQNTLQKALQTVSKRLALSPEEVAEISVPTYDINVKGEKHIIHKQFSAKIVLTPDGGIKLTWHSVHNKTLKTLPKNIKETQKQEIQNIKKLKKEIASMLSAQKARIESIYLQKKCWNYKKWNTYYFSHPLISTIAKRLIWIFEDKQGKQSAIWYENAFINSHGEKIVVHKNSKVSLWHPILCEMEETLLWRSLLVKKQITQPFKQAYREVYIVTDAEKTTEQYSNRFASHILKQHQFHALCQQRNWKYSLQSQFWEDSQSDATRIIPKWNIKASFWTDTMDDNEVNSSDVNLYIVTDQVRFESIEPHETILQKDVPKIVFSEIMRDVDLFVGVTSIGNNPQWADNNGKRTDYWQSFAFNDLPEIAKTRKEALKTIIPHLKIANKCEIEGNFLRVTGNLRTYKIHIGSTNILMEPNDQYLCIVKGRTTQSKIYLPFEGDQTLSLLLSKAFLLADDLKIEDKTILNQIHFLK